MAGFGLMNYNKPGKGVEKGGPEKQPFFVFIDIVFHKFWKLILLNLLYCLFWMPLPIIGLILSTSGETANPLYYFIGLAASIVLSGPITCGLTFVVRNYARQEQAFLWSDFWGATKANWKKGLAASVIGGIVYALLGFAAYFYILNRDNTDFPVVFYIGIVLAIAALLIFTFMQYYIYISIVSTNLSLRKTYKNAFNLALAGLPRNLLISIIIIPCVIILLLLAVEYQTALLIAFPISLFFTFSFGCLIIVFIAYPYFQKMVIDPYYREHPEEVSDTMRTWGYMSGVESEKKPQETEDEEEGDPEEFEEPVKA